MTNNNLKKLWLREKYIAIHGQSFRFRLVKWIILIAVGYCVFLWKGWAGVGWLVLSGAILGIGLHFVLRWKTRGWTQPWGPMKEVIKTPFDGE